VSNPKRSSALSKELMLRRSMQRYSLSSGADKSRRVSGRIPLYLVVRAALREAVDAGAFPPGQRMPSTRGISQQMRVSLVTAHRALQQLVADGVLECRPGRGTYVRQILSPPLTTFRRPLAQMAMKGSVSSSIASPATPSAASPFCSSRN
jgi:DNA-binding GntR family transcriptional regulator